jgi:cytochrome c oxidase subunit IV
MSAIEERTDQREPGTELPEHQVAHPGPREYVKIAIALAFVTLLEVVAYYAEQGTFGFRLPSSALVAILVVMMVIKFALVVLWFMHLRFDSPMYKRLFLSGLGLALSVFLIVLLTFGAGFLPTLASVGGALILLGVFLMRRRSHA